MTIRKKMPAKKHRLFILILAVLLLLLAAGALYAGSHNFAIRCVGLVAIMASIYLVRLSRAHTRSDVSVASGAKATKRPKWPMWAIGIALLPLVGASYLYLQSDIVHGGQTTWPVYVFASLMFACSMVWIHLVWKSLTS